MENSPPPGLNQEPEILLRRVARVEHVEMPRNGWWSCRCAGSAGVPEGDAELAARSAERTREAGASGADLVLTSGALCALSCGDLTGAPLPSQDLPAFAAEAL